MTLKTPSIRILYIDNDSVNQDSFESRYWMQHTICVCSNIQEGIKYIEKSKIDLVIINFDVLKQESQLRLFDSIKYKYANLNCIFLKSEVNEPGTALQKIKNSTCKQIVLKHWTNETLDFAIYNVSQSMSLAG